MTIIELFSGIGAQAKAFEKNHTRHKVLHTCEWDIHAIIAYDLIHNKPGIHPKARNLSKEELLRILSEYSLSNDGKNPMPYSSLRTMSEDSLRLLYSSILKTHNFVSVTDLKGEQLPDNIDVLTYSFPCQDLSNVGAFHGYKKGIDRDAHNRSGLLWEVERILLERFNNGRDLPRFLLLENVPALQNSRHRSNFEDWQNKLREMGYYNKIYILNALDFGLPQNRERLLMLSVLTDNNEDLNTHLDAYFRKHNLESADYRNKRPYKQLNLKDALKTDYSIQQYYLEALECQPNDTVSRREIWEDNPQLTDDNGTIIADRVATLTTKQDRNPNSGNLRVKFNNGKSSFRYLTPRECFLLMGFEEDDYDHIIMNNVQVKKDLNLFTRDKMIRLAGNSIAVNVLQAVFRQVCDIQNKFFRNNERGDE